MKTKLILLLLLLACLVVNICASYSCWRPMVVLGTSMEPTLHPWQVCWMHRDILPLKKGDVVVFPLERETGLLVKRVAALEGATVTVNGCTWRVPKDECYVLGDNSKASVDSREFGTIKQNSIIGKIDF